ncbi:microtubule-associated protein TORTIFOLIA1-like isoform X4 [Carex rostrata]
MATPLSKPFSKSLNTKSPTKPSPATPNPTKPSSVSTHLALVELKSRVLSSLAKLSDRDTQQIAIDDLEKLIRSLPPDGVPVLVNSLTHDPLSGPPDPTSNSKYPPLVLRRESLKLLSSLCTTHTEAASSHLPKIINHITRRLKDPSSDSSVRDTCRDVTGTLASIYATNEASVGLFVKPLMEVMNENSKAAQAGAAMCIAKVVESVGSTTGVNPGPLFQKLCPRICKLLGVQGFLAKGALLSVISSLAQVGAISSQNMQQVLQSTRDCLDNSDWAARKAAADTLCVLSAYSSHLIGDSAAPTLSALESCRFDKVKPVRDSMAEALQQWKKMSGEQAANEDLKPDAEEQSDSRKPSLNSRKSESGKDNSGNSSPTNSEASSRGRGTLTEKAAGLLKKRAPTLTEKDLNPEFFQKMETRKNTDDLAVEVVVPLRKGPKVQSPPDEAEKSKSNEDGSGSGSGSGSGENDNNQTALQARGVAGNDQNSERRNGAWGEQRGLRGSMRLRGSDADDARDDVAGANLNLRSSAAEGSFGNNKGNWMAIQKQLVHLERQQASLMNMLQDFMGGSHDSMVTLENRVRGLERIVEDMARDLSISSVRRSAPGGGPMFSSFDSSPGRPTGKYNGGYHDYPSSKYSRYMMPESSWRPDSDGWGDPNNSYFRSSSMGNRSRGLGGGSNVNNMSAGGTRRGWEKGPGSGPFRLGEGPSARSAWQASKDEATLEAIRVAGEDNINNGPSRVSARAAVPELDGEVIAEDGGEGAQERGPLWEAWTRSMDALHAGDVDSAYGEVLATEDAYLLVKLMEQTGPVVDQLSTDIGNEVLHAVGQLLMEENYFDIALTWLQQNSGFSFGLEE